MVPATVEPCGFVSNSPTAFTRLDAAPVPIAGCAAQLPYPPILTGLEILEGENVLTLYQFNTGTAKNYFCSKCGIYTHHQRRSNPRQFGINVACLEGISPFDFAVVPVSDGVNHLSDHPERKGSDLVGYLRFEHAEK